MFTLRTCLLLQRYVEVARYDGKFRKVIIKTDIDSPRQIAVNPVKGYMYWTDYGQFPKKSSELFLTEVDGSLLFRRTFRRREIFAWTP